MADIMVRAVVVCSMCEKREEFDALLDASIKEESGFYGEHVNTSVVLTTEPENPDMWVRDQRLYGRSDLVWCSIECMKKDRRSGAG